MLKFSANLNFLFKETDFFKRFEEAARAGFKAVEFMFPYEFSREYLKHLLDDNGLKLVLFNLHAGNWENGDRGIAADPARREEFAHGVRQAVSYAEFLGVRQINCLAGKKLAGVADDVQRKTLVENLRLAADELGGAGVKLLVEFVNNYDIPGFYLPNSQKALEIIKEVGRPNVYLQYDIYHAQRAEGELIATIRQNIGQTAHFQLADNPGRHEPGTGEINYPAVFAAIEQTGYDGYIGLEYNPQVSTLASLKWIEEYGLSL